MHPFGMSEAALSDKRAFEDWQASEAADLAGVELPHGEDDFELNVDAWLSYVRPQFRPFVFAWVAEIAGQARVPVSAASLKKLRGMMRRDVDESAGMLVDAAPEVIDAWRRWYPDWIKSLIAEQVERDPWFLLPAQEYYRLKQERKTRDEAAKKQRQRDVKLGADLHAHIMANGGFIRWRPGLLARDLSSVHGGRRVGRRNLTEMAAALVRVGVARWKHTPKRRAWALQATGVQLNVTRLNH